MNSSGNIKILGLNGSPKKNGNTYTLMSWVLEGCKQAGAKIELIHVRDFNITYCQGCHSCLRTGECIIQDDLVEVYQKLNGADGIVVGSPVYSGEPTGYLKILIDRLTLLKLYSDILNSQNSVGVTTSGIAPTKKLAKRIANFFGRRVGIIGVKTASIKRGYQSLNNMNNGKILEKANTLGKTLVESIKNNHHPRTLFYWWITFLRKHLLSRVIKNSPEQFSSVIPIWKKKDWFKIKNR